MNICTKCEIREMSEGVNTYCDCCLIEKLLEDFARTDDGKAFVTSLLKKLGLFKKKKKKK